MLPNIAGPIGATILLLASEPVIRNVICRALESAGYPVLSAGDLGSAGAFLRCGVHMRL